MVKARYGLSVGLRSPKAVQAPRAKLAALPGPAVAAWPSPGGYDAARGLADDEQPFRDKPTTITDDIVGVTQPFLGLNAGTACLCLLARCFCRQLHVVDPSGLRSCRLVKLSPVTWPPSTCASSGPDGSVLVIPTDVGPKAPNDCMLPPLVPS